jgi:hypothetical protein
MAAASPTVVLPNPDPPIRDLLLPGYSPLDERDKMDAEAQKFMRKYFAGKVASPKMDLLLFGRLMQTCEGYKRWLEYMILLEDGPARGPGGRPLPPFRKSAEPVKDGKQEVEPAPKRDKGKEKEKEEIKEGKKEVDLSFNAVTAQREYLKDAAREIHRLIDRAERAMGHAEKVLADYKKSTRDLSRIVKTAQKLLENFREAILSSDPTALALQLEALVQDLSEAIDEIEQATRSRSKGNRSEGSSSNNNNNAAEVKSGVSNLPPGTVHLVGDLHATIDPITLAELKSVYGVEVANLFQTALHDGFIPTFGTGDSGIKQKEPFELKVRMTNLRAYGAPGDLRLSGTVEVRNIGGRAVRVIVFNGIYRGH